MVVLQVAAQDAVIHALDVLQAAEVLALADAQQAVLGAVLAVLAVAMVVVVVAAVVADIAVLAIAEMHVQ